MIAWLEFELTTTMFGVHHVIHFAKRTPTNNALNRSIWPIDVTQTLRDRMDLEVIAIKEYTTSLDLQNQSLTIKR